MKNKYVNQNTAYLYALQESDENTYTLRQDLLSSIALLPSEERTCETLFQFFIKQPELIIAEKFFENKKINSTLFWIYAYAKQSRHFNDQVKINDLYYIGSRSAEKQLITTFIECYPLLESFYPAIFFNPEKIEPMQLRYHKLANSVTNNFDAYFEYAIQEAETATLIKRRNNLLRLQLSESMQKEYSETMNNNHNISFVGQENYDEYMTFALYEQCNQYHRQLREENLCIDHLETDAHYKQLVYTFISHYRLMPFDLHAYNQRIQGIYAI